MTSPLFSWFPLLKFLCAKTSAFSFIFSPYFALLPQFHVVFPCYCQLSSFLYNVLSRPCIRVHYISEVVRQCVYESDAMWLYMISTLFYHSQTCQVYQQVLERGSWLQVGGALYVNLTTWVTSWWHLDGHSSVVSTAVYNKEAELNASSYTWCFIPWSNCTVTQSSCATTR